MEALPAPQIGLSDPILEGETMRGTSWGPRRDGTIFRPHISVRNVGSARTILRDWTLVAPAHNLYIGVNLPESDYTGNMQQVRDEIAHRKKAIDPGDALEFEFTFVIPISRDQIGGTATEIRFRDIKNRWHTIPWTFPN